MKRHIILLSLLFLIQGKILYSQPDSILSQPPDKQVLHLWKWYYPGLVKKDSLQVVTELITAEKNFDGKNNELLKRETWLIRQLYNAERNSSSVGASMMLKAANTAAERNWSLIEAECWHYTGNFYFKAGMFVQAFEYMQKAQGVFDKFGTKKYPHTPRYADALANCYYHFGEFPEAIYYLKKMVHLPASWSSLIHFPSVNNTIALSYQQLKQYDSAIIWFRGAYEVAASMKDSFYMALANGNLGYTFYLQGYYDRALPLLEADYATSVRWHEFESSTNAAILLTTIYIKKGQLPAARKYIELSREWVYHYQIASMFMNWYENLYEYAKAARDQQNIELYADSLLIYKDSLSLLRNKKAFNQAVLKIEAEKHLNEVNQLENRRRHQILLRNSLLAGLVLLTIIALLWINRQLLKRNKEKQLVQQELQFARQELINYTQQLKEKNKLLEHLRNEVNNENAYNERAGHINRLLGATILTEEDWKKFRQLFIKVYPGFFVRLKEKMPDLSATDTRLLALTKLQLPPREMATMLGVSYDAVKKARQRLRKKINLPEDGGLEELVEMI